MASKNSSSTRWVLIADSSRARIYVDEEGTLQLVEKLDHPESRAKTRDLVTDANGRKPAGPSFARGQSRGATADYHGRPGAEPDTDPKEVEAEKFARELVNRLKRAFDSHAFDTLVFAAPPKFLGTVKSMMDTELERHIEAFVSKDLTHYADRQVKEHIDRSLNT